MPVLNLRIDSREVETYLRRVGAYAKQRWPNRTMHAVANRAVTLLQENSPEGETGKLKNSWVVEHETPARKKVTSTCDYASYVNDGIPPSKGRYVPVLEARLVNPSKRNPDIGMHPGFKGRHFVEKSITKLESEVEGMIEREVQL